MSETEIGDPRMNPAQQDWVQRVIRENKGTPFDLVFWDWDGIYSLHRLPTRIEQVPCFFWDDFVRAAKGWGWRVERNK